MKKLLLPAVLFFCLLSLNCFAQNKNIVSLLTLIKKDKEDTLKVIRFNDLCREYAQIGLFDTAIRYVNASLKLAEQLLQRSKNSSEAGRVKILIADSYGSIGIINRIRGNYSQSLEYNFKALNIDEELGNKNDIIARLGNIGNVYYDKGDYPIALDYLFKALKLAAEIKNKNYISTNLGNIGNVYSSQGNYPQALYYHLKTLEMDEERGDKNDIAGDFCNIGDIYERQADYSKALNYFNKALKLGKEIGNKTYIEIFLGDIGNVYKLLAQLILTPAKAGSSGAPTKSELLSKSLDYYFKALKMAQELGDKNGVVRHLDNIGTVYAEQKDYPKALDYFFMGLKRAEEIGEKGSIADCLNNIGSAYSSLKKYNEAFNYTYKALALSDSIGAKNSVKDCYSNLSDLYKQANVPLPDTIGSKLLTLEQMRLRSLYYFKRSIEIRDTLFSQENKKQLVQSAMTYEFDKKELASKAEQDKKDAITASESKKQKIIIISVAGGLLLVMIFAGLIFRSLRITRRQKNIIELQKNEVIEQKNEVTKQKDIADSQRIIAVELREIAENQKHIVEEKQKEILDSITYARRIQRALLTSDEYIKNNFTADLSKGEGGASEYFILFKPKDIVSGDFYWALRTPPPLGETGRGLFYIAAADCTGHGVPGAFMSMLNISYFNENVIERGIRLPHDILNAQRTEIIKALNPLGSKEVSKDGMDCILCAYDLDKKLLHFAAANNPLWLVRNGELIEYKADKMPVGKYMDDVESFTLQKIELQKGDIIYTSTDGFADQFGTNGKKMMKKTFKEELLKIHQSPMKEQKEYLNNFFESWKGNTEQVDDVCVIGVRI